MNQLVVGPNGDVFAIAGNALHQDLYRSPDRGVTWNAVLRAEGGVSGVAVGPTGTIVATTGVGDVLRSRDAGATWQALDHPSDYVFAIAFAPGGELFTGGGAVYRSDDDGQSWRSLGLEGPGVHAFAFTDSNTVVAATGQGLYRSDGSDWLRIDSTIYPTALAVLPDSTVLVGVTGVGALEQRSGVFRLEAGGHLTLLGLDGISVVSLAVDPDGTMYAGTSGQNNGFVSFPPAGVYRSDDAGRTWTQAGLISTAVPALALDPDGTLYAGTQGLFTDTGSLLSRGILSSTDRGTTWRPSAQGLPFARTYGLSAGPGGAVYALADHSVFRTLDRGATWEAVYTDEATEEAPYPPYYRLAVHPDGDLFLLAGHPFRSDGINVVLYMPGRLLHSADQGETWSPVEGTPHDVGPLAITPAGTLLMAAPEGLLRSTDHGRSWAPVETTFHDPYVIDVRTTGTDTAYAATWNPETWTASVFVSTDDGSTWSAHRNVDDVVVPEYLVLATGRTGALYVAHDYEPQLQASLLSLLVDATRTLYAASGGTLYRSGDEGMTWETVESPLLTDTGIQALTIGSDGILYAGTDQGVFRSASSVLTPTEEAPSLPDRITAGPNYPNPFDRSTLIPFTLAHPARVTVRIYDLLGREIALLLDDAGYGPGRHDVVWDAAGVPSGTYVYQIRTGGTVLTGRLVVVH